MKTDTKSGMMPPNPSKWNGWEAENLRLQAGFTQEQFGYHILGIGESTVRKIEKEGTAYKRFTSLQRQSLDALLYKVQQMPNEGGLGLDKRWGVRK